MKSLYDVITSAVNVFIVCHTEQEVRDFVDILMSIQPCPFRDKRLIMSMPKWLLQEGSAFNLVREHGDATFNFEDGEWDGYCWKEWYESHGYCGTYVDFASVVSVDINSNDVFELLQG